MEAADSDFEFKQSLESSSDEYEVGSEDEESSDEEQDPFPDVPLRGNRFVKQT